MIGVSGHFGFAGPGTKHHGSSSLLLGYEAKVGSSATCGMVEVLLVAYAATMIVFRYSGFHSKAENMAIRSSFSQGTDVRLRGEEKEEK